MTTENQYLNDWNYLYTPENDWDDFDETMSTEIANSQNHPIFYDLSNEDKFDEQRRLAKARRYWHNQTSNVDNKYYKPGRKAVEKPKEDKVEMLSNGKVVPPLNWENPTYTNWALDNGASASNLSPTELFYKKNDPTLKFDNSYVKPKNPFNLEPKNISPHILENFEDLIVEYENAIKNKTIPSYNAQLAYNNRNRISNEMSSDPFTEDIIENLLSNLDERTSPGFQEEPLYPGSSRKAVDVEGRLAYEEEKEQNKDKNLLNPHKGYTVAYNSEPERFPYAGSAKINGGYSILNEYDAEFTQKEHDAIIDALTKPLDENLSKEEQEEVLNKYYDLYGQGFRLIDENGEVLDPVMPGGLMYGEPEKDTVENEMWKEYAKQKTYSDVWDDFTSNLINFVPFFHETPEFYEISKVISIANEIQNGGEPSHEDMLYITDYVRKQEWSANQTSGANIVEGILTTIPYMFDFIATALLAKTGIGLVAGGGQMLAKKAGLETAKSQLKKLFNRKFMNKLNDWATKSGVNKIARNITTSKVVQNAPNYIARTTIFSETPVYITNDKGEKEWVSKVDSKKAQLIMPGLDIDPRTHELAIQPSSIDESTAENMARYQTHLEYLSENLGAMFFQPMFRMFKGANARYIQKAKMIDAIKKKNPIEDWKKAGLSENQYYKTIGNFLKVGGYDGLIEEYLEERANQAGLAIAHTLGDNGFLDPKWAEAGWEWKTPTAREFFEELAVLAFFPGVQGSIGTANEFYKNTRLNKTKVGKYLNKEIESNEKEISLLTEQFDQIEKELDETVETEDSKVEQAKSKINDKIKKQKTLLFAKEFIKQNPYYFDEMGIIDIIDKSASLTIQDLKDQGFSTREIEEIWEGEGNNLDTEEAQIFGSTEWSNFEGMLKVMVKLYSGADTGTVVEEMMGFAYKNLSPEQKKLFRDYWATQDSGLTEQEFFEQQAQLFFHTNIPGQYGGMVGNVKLLFKNLKDKFLKTLNLHKENLDPRLQDMYMNAGMLKPTTTKDTSTPIGEVYLDRKGNVTNLLTADNIAYSSDSLTDNVLLNKIFNAEKKRKTLEKPLPKSREDLLDEDGNVIGLEEEPSYQTERKLKIEEVSAKLAGEWTKGDVLKIGPKSTDEEKAKAVDALVRYADYIIDRNNLSSGWWTTHSEKVMTNAIESGLAPQLQDPLVRDVFKMILSLTSQNTALIPNHNHAFDALSVFFQTGNIDDIKLHKDAVWEEDNYEIKKENTTRGEYKHIKKGERYLKNKKGEYKQWGLPAIATNISKYKDLVKDKGGVELARGYLMTESTRGEINEWLVSKGYSELSKSTKSNLDEVMYPSIMFGPKIGEMYQALNGMEATAPLDLWMNRFYEVATGHIILDSKGKLIDTPDATRKELLRKAIKTVQKGLKKAGYDVDYGGVQASIWVDQINIFESVQPQGRVTDWGHHSKRYNNEYKKFKESKGRFAWTSEHIQGLNENAIRRLYTTYRVSEGVVQKGFQRTGKFSWQEINKEISYQIKRNQPLFHDKLYLKSKAELQTRIPIQQFEKWIANLGTKGIKKAELDELNVDKFIEDSKELGLDTIDKNDFLNHLVVNKVELNVYEIGTSHLDKILDYAEVSADNEIKRYYFFRKEDLIKGAKYIYLSQELKQSYVDSGKSINFKEKVEELVNNGVVDSVDELIAFNVSLPYFTIINEDAEFSQQELEKQFRMQLQIAMSGHMPKPKYGDVQVMPEILGFRIDDYYEGIINMPKFHDLNNNPKYRDHWDEKFNKKSLAHFRYTIRTNVETGEKVLFVEEVQSDYEQSIGIKRQQLEQIRKIQIKNGWVSNDADLPKNPYKQFNWVSLAVKAIVRKGAEKGVDRIVFTTGKERNVINNRNKLTNIAYQKDYVSNGESAQDDIYNMSEYEVEVTGLYEDIIKIKPGPALSEKYPDLNGFNVEMTDVGDFHGANIKILADLSADTKKARAFEYYITNILLGRGGYLTNYDNKYKISGIDVNGVYWSQLVTDFGLNGLVGKELANKIRKNEGSKILSIRNSDQLFSLTTKQEAGFRISNKNNDNVFRKINLDESKYVVAPKDKDADAFTSLANIENILNLNSFFTLSEPIKRLYNGKIEEIPFFKRFADREVSEKTKRQTNEMSSYYGKIEFTKPYKGVIQVNVKGDDGAIYDFEDLELVLLNNKMPAFLQKKPLSRTITLVHKKTGKIVWASIGSFDAIIKNLFAYGASGSKFNDSPVNLSTEKVYNPFAKVNETIIKSKDPYFTNEKENLKYLFGNTEKYLPDDTTNPEVYFENLYRTVSKEFHKLEVLKGMKRRTDYQLFPYKTEQKEISIEDAYKISEKFRNVITSMHQLLIYRTPFDSDMAKVPVDEMKRDSLNVPGDFFKNLYNTPANSKKALEILFNQKTFATYLDILQNEADIGYSSSQDMLFENLNRFIWTYKNGKFILSYEVDTNTYQHGITDTQREKLRFQDFHKNENGTIEIPVTVVTAKDFGMSDVYALEEFLTNPENNPEYEFFPIKEDQLSLHTLLQREKRDMVKLDDKKRIKILNTSQPSFHLNRDAKGILSNEGLEIPHYSFWQKTLHYVQDEMVRLKKIQEHIGVIDEDLDAYMAHELFIGRTKNRWDIESKKLDDFEQRLLDDDIGIEDFGDFLYFRHASERDAHILKKNEPEIEKLREKVKNSVGKNKEKYELKLNRLLDKTTAGSGKTKEEQGNYWASLSPTRGMMLENYAKEFDKLLKNRTLDVLLDAGIITTEKIEEFKNTFQFYVPLKGFETEGMWEDVKKGIRYLAGSKKKYNVSSTGIIGAFGRRSSADNPYIQAKADLLDAITRAEKNLVLKKLHDLIQEYPDDNVWKAESLKYIPNYDADGNMKLMSTKEQPINQVRLWIDGKAKVITFIDPGLKEAFAKSDKKEFVKFLEKGSAKFSNVFRAINTTLSPAFMVTNFMRDAMLGGIMLPPGVAKGSVKKVYKGLPGAIRGIYRAERGKDPKNKWGKWYADYKADGGKVGWMEQRTIEDIRKDTMKKVRRLQKHGNFREAMEVTQKFIEDSNMAVENGIRLSTYKTLRESGYSRKKSAQVAKNLTVNFNKRGAMPSLINLNWIFLNAGIQGSANILGKLTSSDAKIRNKVQSIFLGFMTASFLNNLLQRLLTEGGSEDDDWDGLDDWRKDNKITFSIPGTKWNIGIPVGYGVNVPWAMGAIAENYMASQEWYQDLFGLKKGSGITFGNALNRLTQSFHHGFVPVGGGSLGQVIAPTIADPFIQYYENKDWLGRPIYKSENIFGQETPHHQRGFDFKTNETLKDVTKWLWDNTGKEIDVNPMSIQIAFDNVFGGAGRFYKRFYNVLESPFTGVFPEADQLPFIRVFAGKNYASNSYGIFTKMYDEAQRNVYTDNEIQLFYRQGKYAVNSGRLTQEEYDKKVAEFRLDQFELSEGKLPPKPGRRVSTIKEKRKFKKKLKKRQKND